MRVLTCFLALVAMTAISLGQLRHPPLRPELVVSGTVGRVSGNTFTVLNTAGTYTVQVTSTTSIASPLTKGTRGIVPGAYVTVQGVVSGRLLVARRIVVHRNGDAHWTRKPPPKPASKPKRTGGNV